MTKERKSAKSEVKESVNVLSAQKSHNFFESIDFFSNIKEVNTIVTVDMSKLDIVDYMSSSRIDFFRKLVKKNATFTQIALIDYKYYDATNDRSKSRKFDKYDCDCSKECIRNKEKKEVNNTCFDNSRCQHLHLNVNYSRQRTSKQLNDVLKERDIRNFLDKKYNRNTYMTSEEYQKLVR